MITGNRYTFFRLFREIHVCTCTSVFPVISFGKSFVGIGGSGKYR